jgi:hypothetical protein
MGDGEHPLNPDLQGRVRKTEGSDVRIEGVECREYSFTLELEKGAMTGTLALDAVSGEPELMSWTLDPLPPFMSELSVRSRYERAPFGVSVLSSVDFSGAGGILFLRKEIFGTLSLSSYDRN